MVLVLNKPTSRIDSASALTKLKDLVSVADVNLPVFISSLNKVYQDLSNTAIPPNELDEIQAFLKAVEAFYKSLKDYYPDMEVFLTTSTNLVNMKAPQRQSLLSINAVMLQTSDHLRALSSTCHPVKKEEDQLQMLLHLVFPSGPAGIEKIAFPVMRESLVIKFNATRHQLTGADGNLIDTIVFPGSSPEDWGRAHQSAGTHEAFKPSSIGCVLFCSPNAVLYECTTLCARDMSWLGVYLSLGLDVCFFNYRGYGSSSGMPSPSGVCSDGMVVYNFLREKLKMCSRMIVHGESIGGLAASHIARNGQVDTLICDRTFASLDAVAARMMGSFMGYSLRYIALWSTDVVENFINAKCSKIVLQDPHDEVINHTASLKTGVATRLVLKDASWMPRSADRIYLIADAGGDDVPLRDKEKDFLRKLESPADPTIEEFIQHFYACLSHIARCSKFESESMQTQESSEKRGKSPRRSEEGWEDIVRVSAARRRTSSSDVRDTIVSLPSSDPPSDSCGSSVHDGNSDELNESGELIDSHESVETLPSPNKYDIRMISFMDLPEEASLGVINKAYMSIVCVNGQGGQLLGQALALGYDHVRAWVCNYLVWTQRSLADPLLASLGPNSQPSTAIDNLIKIVDQFEKILFQKQVESSARLSSRRYDEVDERVDESKDPPHQFKARRGQFVYPPPRMDTALTSIKFILASFQAFSRCIESSSFKPTAGEFSSSIPIDFQLKFMQNKRSSLSSPSSSSSLVNIPSVKKVYENNTSESSSEESTSFVDLDDVLSTISSTVKIQISSESDSSASPALAAADIGIGCLMSLHNGHNGWLSEVDVNTFKNFLKYCGIEVNV